MTDLTALPARLNALLAGRGMVWVGFSGGLDSSVLLHLAVKAGLAEQGRLRAIHIHHGLQADADRWAELCTQRAGAWGVPCRVERVQVDPAQGLEAGARAARYRCFAALLQPGDTLLLGQHADDQSETLLLRLLRGAGVRGLRAMAAQRPLGAGRLLRPLLALPRATLLAYAEAERLSWSEDGSNADPRFERNYLRHQVLPLLHARWPALNRLFARAARLQGEAHQLLNELADEDLNRCRAGDGLALAALAALSPPRQRNLLRYWLLQHAAEVPEERRLNALLAALGAAPDRQPELRWGRWILARHQGRLRLRGQPAACAPSEPCPWALPAPLAWAGGTLSAEAVVGAGLRLPAGSRVSVVARQGGERLRLPGRAGHRALKKLLQAAAMPPWQRERLPLIYVDGVLAAVADRWVDAAFAAGVGEPGWRIRWQVD